MFPREPEGSLLKEKSKLDHREVWRLLVEEDRVRKVGQSERVKMTTILKLHLSEVEEEEEPVLQEVSATPRHKVTLEASAETDEIVEEVLVGA